MNVQTSTRKHTHTHPTKDALRKKSSKRDPLGHCFQAKLRENPAKDLPRLKLS